MTEGNQKVSIKNYDFSSLKINEFEIQSGERRINQVHHHYLTAEHNSTVGSDSTRIKRKYISGQEKLSLDSISKISKLRSEYSRHQTKRSDSSSLDLNKAQLEKYRRRKSGLGILYTDNNTNTNF